MPIDEVARDAAVQEARTAEGVAEKAAREAVIARDEALHLLKKKTTEAAGLANANAILEVRVKEKIDEGQAISARSSTLVNDAKTAQTAARGKAEEANTAVEAIKDALTVKTKKVDELAVAVTAYEDATQATAIAHEAAIKKAVADTSAAAYKTAAGEAAAKVAALEVRVNEQNVELNNLRSG